MENNILVTGGAGYIGSQVCKQLAQSGFTPVCLDNLSRGHRENVQWGPFVQGSIQNLDLVVETIRTHQIQAVMHFAAFAYIHESVEKPAMYFENNVAGSALLFEAMRETQVKTLVFSSSCATYGIAQAPRISEEHPQQPINPYGLSKLMVERMLAKFRDEQELNYCALRYFNVAGADSDLTLGECHNPEPHIIPNLIKAAQTGTAVTINGRHYPTPDGTCVRDFIHVVDLAQAHILVLKKLLKRECLTNAYNLGNANGFSLLELVEKTQEVVGKKINVQFGENRPGDPPILIADSTKFRRDLGWQPQFSDIETILSTASQWEVRKK